MLPLVIRVEGLEGQPTTVHRFETSPVHVGRNPLNELALKDRFVSQWHGLFIFDGETTQYVDLGSSNGTELDGSQLAPNQPRAVGPNVDLRIGSLRLHVARDAAVKVEYKREQTQFERHADDLLAEVKRQLEAIVGGTEAPPPQPAPLKLDRPVITEETWAEFRTEHQQYRDAWEKLHVHLSSVASGLAPEQKGIFLDAVALRMPAVTQEDAFKTMAGSSGASFAAGQTKAKEGSTIVDSSLLEDMGAPSSWAAAAPTTPPDPAAAAALEFVKLFAQSYAGTDAPVKSARDVKSFLGRLSTILETFAKDFVNLRSGQEQFAQEMGVRLVGDTVVSRARNFTEVLAYLLSPTSDAAARVQELSRGFADLMIHQVAMLAGVRAGLRAVVGELNPDKLAASAKPTAVERLVPNAALIRRWKERVSELTEEEDQLDEIAFGNAFSRAYAVVAGDQKPKRQS